MWLRQSKWKTFDPKMVHHINKCVTTMRHRATTLVDLELEFWHPWIFVTRYGMLRAGPLSKHLQTSWPWAPAGAICVGTVIILRQYRGQGRAHELMQALIARYPSRTLVLAVDPENTAAIALYRRYGFRQAKRTATDLFMQRQNLN